MKNLYVIYGDNNFKIKQEIDKIKNEKNIVDIIKYDLLFSNINEAIIDVATMSLLNDKKIIICENSFFLTASKNNKEQNLDELFKFIKNPNSDNVLILTINNSKLDERKKIVKDLKKCSIIIECSKLSIEDNMNFIKERFKKEKYEINNETINYLYNRVGNDTSLLDNEINKLLLYKKEEKKIDITDIDELVHKQIDEDIFSLVDNLVNNDKNKAFEIYKELITNGEEPIKIIVMLANQFRLIYQVMYLSNEKFSEKEIASKLVIHPYRVKLAKEKSYKFTKEQLKKYLNDLVDLDLKIKTNKIDKYLGLELFILQI